MSHTNTITRKGRILSIKMETRADESPDTSTIGEYTDEGGEDTMLVCNGEFYIDVTRRARILDKLADLAYDAETAERGDYWRTKGKRLTAKWVDVCELPERSREYRYFRPYAGGEAVGTKDWRTYAKQDFKRMRGLANGNWCYVGIIARAEYTLPGSDIVQRLTSGGLWGVESDSGKEYIAEVEGEELIALRGELETIGFGKRQIDQAFGKVERVNR